jgi:pleiotropic regulator 1
MSSATADSEVPPLSNVLIASRKRTLAIFHETRRLTSLDYPAAQRVRAAVSLLDGYRTIAIPTPAPARVADAARVTGYLLTNGKAAEAAKGGGGVGAGAPLLLHDAGGIAASGVPRAPSVLSAISIKNTSSSLVVYGGGGSGRGAVSDVAAALAARAAPAGVAIDSLADFARVEEMREAAAMHSRALVSRRAPARVPEPKWHAPWKLSRVISGHQGWVRALAVEPGNEWFASGAADRTIKVWDVASGALKVTLTGHINTVRALCISARHPYMFSAGEDKMVKCWDLETNKVVRAYDGHLSGVYSLALHPTLDVLVSGGRDSTCRVWDFRTRTQVHVLGGHESTVAALLTSDTDPQVISGSMDCTIRLWDLAAGKVRTVLTHHKKSVRSLVAHPREFSFLSGAADRIKKWALPEGTLVGNLSGHDAIVNSLAINADDVLVSGGDDGSLRFWDYETGYSFQNLATRAQPGSLDAESGIYALAFDQTGG